MRKITLLILLLCFTLNAWTYDFTSGSFSYNIISETEQTVEVFYNEYTKTVSIPETVRYNGKTYTVVKIGAEAFFSRKELETVYIPKTVKEIGAGAFAYCSYLKNVNCLGQELEIIGREAFYYTSITSFNFPPTLKSIGFAAFRNSDLGGNITIPNSVTVLGKEVFTGCKIQSITIGNGITIIPEHAFWGCDNLASVVIPESVRIIENYAFLHCDKLVSIYLRPKNPPTIENLNAFYNNGDENLSLYVPCGAENNYTLSEWVSVASNITEICTKVYISAQSTTGGTITGIGTYTYGDNVTLKAVPNAHYHFVRWLDGYTNNPRALTVFESTSFGAEFAIDTHEIIVTADKNGSATGSGVYSYGETITLAATANAHYHFSRWSDGNTDNPRSYVVSNDATLTAEFAIDTHNIVVNESENGTVTGSGTYNYGTTAVLTAIANDHYHFVKWSDGNTDNPRTFTVSQDITLSAEFAIDTHEVIVKSDENGTVTGSGVYNYGETITLAATANAHYHFVRWFDGNTDNPRSYVVTKDATITAEFSIDRHNVIVSDIENGTVTGEGTYNYGDTVTLNAIPNEGYHFVQWSNGNPQKTLTFIITEDVTLSAEFSINIYKIVVTADNGTVAGTGTYTHGDSVTITATPSNGYHFVRWSNGSIKNPLTFVATENLTLKAEFAPNTYEIITSAVNGTIIGSGTYKYGDVATLTATSNDHYHFVRWSDGNTENPRVITVTQDTIFIAEFAIDTHEVIVKSDENGTVTGSGVYSYGETITLAATANAHYHFSRWSDGNTDNPRSYVVTNDVMLTAEFAIDTHNIVVSGSENGTVTGAGTYKYGDVATLTAVANDHYHFVRWSDGSIDNPRVITVTQDLTLSAEFAIDTHKVTVNADENGSAIGSGTYNYGETITLTATPNAHYHFSKWSDGNTDNPRSYVVTNDVMLTAEFAIDTHNIVVRGCENGTVTGAGTYNYGDTVTLSITPNEGYKFVRWSDGKTDNPRTIIVTEDITLGVELELLTYIVSVSCHETHGTVSGSGTYKHGETIVLTATANKGYKFAQWNDGNINDQRTLIVTSDTILIATFEEIQCKLTLVSNDPTMGSVFGEGTYKYGTEVSINAVANTGYQFTQWSDNNFTEQRTLIITTDISLTAYFQPIKYVVTAIANDEKLGTVYGGGEYAYNTSVSLMAVANDGAEFVTWTNGVVENPYIFKAVENMAIQAIFKTIPSGVDDVHVDENTTTKILQNGQLFIIRDGKTYTIMGQKVK